MQTMKPGKGSGEFDFVFGWLENPDAGLLGCQYCDGESDIGIGSSTTMPGFVTVFAKVGGEFVTLSGREGARLSLTNRWPRTL